MASSPSIFNDVIGPVMRGPSSSHCAAALRIGRLARDLMDGAVRDVLVQYDPAGSLATTHASQGSDMGLFAGLLGWDATDPRLADAARVLAETGIRARIEIVDYGAAHSNTYKLALANEAGRHELVAISTGGGMVELIAIDGIAVSIAGDGYETLLGVAAEDAAALSALVAGCIPDAHLRRWGQGALQILSIGGGRFPEEETLSRLRSAPGVRWVKTLAPVLPVLAQPGASVPFLTASGLQRANQGRGLALWELAVEYESARGGLAPGQVVERMEAIVGILESSLRQGLAGTEYADRILGYQSGPFVQAMRDGRLLDAGLLNRMVAYVAALMEVKSSMGVVVAAPTAGACGGLPGACLAAAEAMGLGTHDIARALLAAGLIGVFIASRATLSAELGGCQAECGAGSGMAAAALVDLAGGSADQALAAASMALQNTLGMICDPVANRVEVPCLGKNVLAAANALACANMALAGFDAVVPLDEVIETMDAVGRALPRELRCTALGGLSITATSRAIERRLAGPQ